MTSKNRSRLNDESSATDRLALSRAQHLQLRAQRPKSISDDEIDAISDWSDSDRECCPLSDFESNLYEDDFIVEKKLPNILLENIPSRKMETPVTIIDDSLTSTQISFMHENEKETLKVDKVTKMTMSSIKIRQTPLLPARRQQNKEIQPTNRSGNSSQLSYTSRYRKPISPSPTRFYQRRETTSTSASSNTHLTKDSSSSSFHSQDEQNHARHIVSPNLSQASVPRAYEIKKIFVDDSDYGRLTDVSSTRSSQPRNRQKWGTIVHPPFPLGYQQVSPDHVTQVVERLSSPVRCRERHAPIQTPSKRYLSVEETEALISRLTKVKPIRSPDQYWPIQRQSRSVKSINNHNNNNWKTVGISA